MKKKIFALLMVICLIFAMATGCSGASDKETDSGGGKTETETEAPAADDQQAESEESDEVTTEEEDAVKETEDSSAESETPDVVLTADTEITDEDIQEIYASIKDSITTNYLEPNGINPADFNWPSSDSESWKYFGNLYNNYSTNLHLNIPLNEAYIPPADDTDEKIMDATFTGILNWINKKGTCNDEYFVKLFMEYLYPFNNIFPSNITFE